MGMCHSTSGQADLPFRHSFILPAINGAIRRRSSSVRPEDIRTQNGIHLTEGTDPAETVLLLRKRLEQFDRQLMDMRAASSSDGSKLLRDIMQEVNAFEIDLANEAERDVNEIHEGDEMHRPPLNLSDVAGISLRVFNRIMEFRTEEHEMQGDLNDLIADSNLDSQTKKWLTNEFTRTSISRPTHFSLSIAKSLTGGSETFVTPLPPQIIDAVVFDPLISHEDFNILEHSFDNSKIIAYRIFETAGVLKPFEIEARKMVRLIECIAEAYVNSNEFHTFLHGVDVLHSSYIIFQRASLDNITTVWQKFGFLLAALSHDVAHPGTNNAFQVNTGSPLALLYNDQSVLENHHAATLFRILSDPEVAIFGRMKPSLQAEIRHLIISSILATDMKFHFELVGKGDMVFEKIKMYQSHVADGSELSPAVEDSRKKEVKLGLNIIMHCSDVNNIFKPWPVAKIWSDKVMEEFYKQGDMERKLRLPISPFMDRNKDSQAQMSLNFIDFIGAPLVALITESLKNIDFMIQNMIAVRQSWYTIRKQEIGAISEPERSIQLAMLESRHSEFELNFSARFMSKRSTVSRAAAMLNAKHRDSALIRRSSLSLAAELETKLLKGWKFEVNENELKRSSSCEDLTSKSLSQQTKLPKQFH